VRVVQRDFERVFAGLGELRTYKGSRLKLVMTGLSILR
jgi:hypothetical protein